MTIAEEWLGVPQVFTSDLWSLHLPAIVHFLAKAVFATKFSALGRPFSNLNHSTLLYAFSTSAL